MTKILDVSDLGPAVSTVTRHHSSARYCLGPLLFTNTVLAMNFLNTTVSTMDPYPLPMVHAT
jgi:hypothetical protein